MTHIGVFTFSKYGVRSTSHGLSFKVLRIRTLYFVLGNGGVGDLICC